MATRSIPEILAALDKRGLLDDAHQRAAAFKVPVGEAVCPTSRAGRRARALLFAVLHGKGLSAAVIAETFGVGTNVVWNDLYAVAAERAETIPPPEAS